MATRRKTLIQMAAENVESYVANKDSCEIEYLIYKETLIVIESILSSKRIAKQSILDISEAFYKIIEGFYTLRSDIKFKKKTEIMKLTPILNKANSHLQFAIVELQTKGKTSAYFEAVGSCREYIFQINLQLA